MSDEAKRREQFWKTLAAFAVLASLMGLVLLILKSCQEQAPDSPAIHQTNGI